MLKQFLKGLVFGTGFTVAFVVIYTIWFTWGFPKYLSHGYGFESTGPAKRETGVADPPILKDTQKFLGSTGIYSGDFEHFNSRVLAAGDGKIIGSVTANNQPVSGVKIRLALNGSVFSQWAESGEDGTYIVAVPYGEYRIDGYDLDQDSANKHLPGKINKPMISHSSNTFSVGPETPGEGLTLKYIDPVIVLEPTGEVSLTDDIVARWEPYPGASSYVVQVYEYETPHQFSWDGTLFEWRERPRVTESFMNLREHGAEFKAGQYYTLTVTAEDDRSRPISETSMRQRERHFKVTD